MAFLRQWVLGRASGWYKFAARAERLGSAEDTKRQPLGGLPLPSLSLFFFFLIFHCLVTKSCLTLRPHGLWPARLLCPWDFPGKNTGVGCRFLLQTIFFLIAFNKSCPNKEHSFANEASKLLAYPGILQSPFRSE